MAVPSTPSNVLLQQGNGQVLLSWNLTATATSYSVQRSTDGVTFSVVGTPTPNQYLDTAVTVGTNYYYQVAAVNGSGTGAYSAAQSIVPTYSGQLSLGQARLEAQQRADRVNSQFVTTTEWNTYIVQSYFELYDLLVTVYEDYFLAPVLTLTTTGATGLFPLPNGLNYNGAAPFYKLMGVDCGLSNGSSGFVTVKKFNFISRNRYVFPNAGSNYLYPFNMQYRVMGSNIQIIPNPQANQTINVWYIPRLAQPLLDTDILDGVSGWLEYVIVDAAIKALQKEESDVSVLMAQKMALKSRIEESAMNRDAGQSSTISETRDNSGCGTGDFGPNGGGPSGGW